jgi:hypothetical protein
LYQGVAAAAASSTHAIAHELSGVLFASTSSLFAFFSASQTRLKQEAFASFFRQR